MSGLDEQIKEKGFFDYCIYCDSDIYERTKWCCLCESCIFCCMYGKR
jgi:hypothetical protein